jgi:hypothetical protein
VLKPHLWNLWVFKQQEWSFKSEKNEGFAKKMRLLALQWIVNCYFWMDRSLSVSSSFIPKKGVCAEIMQQLYFLFM